jgi:NAD(P)-dependent dehydrogenase (short-subunit alcohol dehydrogenase family)
MDNRTQFKGKVAIVTGSTGGMGAGIARRLAAEGARLVISGRRVEHGEQVARDIRNSGGQALFVRADISSEADCVNLIRTTLEHLDRLDILVNNAAITPDEPPGEQSTELWDQVFDINVRGAFICCREAIPTMRRHGGGCIINIGSTVPFRGKMDRLAYGCSKGALWVMTKMMARDLVCDHILVNWISVGWVATPGEVELRDKLHSDGLSFLEEVGKSAPLGRLETVEDIAAGVAYLASDDANHVTGCDLNISGGLWI